MFALGTVHTLKCVFTVRPLRPALANVKAFRHPGSNPHPSSPVQISAQISRVYGGVAPLLSATAEFFRGFVFSGGGGCFPLRLPRRRERETVDKESDVKDPGGQGFFFSLSPPIPTPDLPPSLAPSPPHSTFFDMKGVVSCGGMPRLKWASSICGLCNGMKEQLCSPLQGGSVYPHYLVNAPLASRCCGARG